MGLWDLETKKDLYHSWEITFTTKFTRWEQTGYSNCLSRYF